MNKKKKILFITAGLLVLAGCIVFICVMSKVGWNFKKLSTVEYVTNTHEIRESFDDVSIITDTADITFVLSDEGNCGVTCYEEKNAKHSVAVENNALVIKIDDNRELHDYVGFRFDTPKITVLLPKNNFNSLFVKGSTGNVEASDDFAFGSAEISLSTGNADFCAAVSGTVKIKTSTGNIGIKNTSVGSLDLSVTTGKVTVVAVTCGEDARINVSTGKATLTDVTCRNLISDGSTGNITLSRVVAEKKLSVERSTDNVKFVGCDAAEIYVKTSTGDVKGNLLSDKVFVTDTSTGDVDVPASAGGGRCEIRTSTGDIEIKIG